MSPSPTSRSRPCPWTASPRPIAGSAPHAASRPPTSRPDADRHWRLSQFSLRLAISEAREAVLDPLPSLQKALSLSPHEIREPKALHALPLLPAGRSAGEGYAPRRGRRRDP